MPICTNLRFLNPIEFQPCAVGEPAFINDLKVIASYDDGTEREITVTYRMFNDSNMHTAEAERICFVIFEGQKLKFSIPVLPCTLTDIDVETLRDLEFLEGEMFDRKSIRVTAFYDDGHSKEITTYKIVPFAPLAPSQTEVTIKYGRQTKKLNIKVVPKKQKILSVNIAKLPNKLQYLLNDKEVDLTGGQLKIDYENGTSELIDMISDVDAQLESARSGKGKVELQYCGNKICFYVEVLIPVIQDISIKQLPLKQEYIEGETLNLAGLVLCVKYNDGSEREVTDLDNQSFLLYSAHTYTGVNLTYKGYQLNIPVIVKKPEEKIDMTQISLSTPPAKRRFIEGEALDFTGAQLMLQYSNGTREIVDVTPDMIKAGDCSKPGMVIVLIEYKGYSLEEHIVVHGRKIDHLEIVSPPQKTNYIEHEPVNADGMVVKACYDNGDQENVMNYTVMPEVVTLETDRIKIQHDGYEAEFPIMVAPVSIVKLDWERLPEKRNYFVHEKDFSYVGGVLKVVYNTGEIKSVSLDSSIISGFNTNQVGQCTIIAEYEGQRLPFTITVQDRILLGIRMKQMPRTYYMAGERFNPEGMKVETIYSGGVNEEVECTFRPDRPLRADDNFVVIAYQDKALMLDLVVTEPKPESEPVQEVISLEAESNLAQEADFQLESNVPLMDSEFPESADHPVPDSDEPVSDMSDIEQVVPGDPDFIPNEDYSEEKKETVNKVHVPHFYPSTFCIRFL